MGIARDGDQEMRPNTGVSVRRGSMVDPAVEKYLLNLQRAMNVDAFWKAAQQLLTAAKLPSDSATITKWINGVVGLLNGIPVVAAA